MPIDATRGSGDWTDDTHAVVRALGIDAPVHLAGWSTGGAAVAGSGGGAGNPEFTSRIAADDRSADDPVFDAADRFREVFFGFPASTS